MAEHNAPVMAASPRGVRPAGAQIEILAPATRFVLRLRQERLETLERLTGLSLPRRIGTSTATAGLRASRLGPDEWWLGGTTTATMLQASLALVGAEVPHGLVDISDRDRDIGIVGERVVDILAGGCPLDLERMKTSSITRSVFGSAEVVLCRADVDEFQMSVARSYVPYVHGLILKIAHELDVIESG